MINRDIKIVNSGTKEFPFYQVMIDGEEYCATEHIENAQEIVKLLDIPGVINCMSEKVH